MKIKKHKIDWEQNLKSSKIYFIFLLKMHKNSSPLHPNNDLIYNFLAINKINIEIALVK